MTNITIPKKVVEQALEALCDTETPDYRPQYEIEYQAIYDLRCALDQCEAEDPAKRSWTETIRLAKVALHEMPRPHTDWMHAAKAVCESVVKVGHNLEQEPVAWGSGDGYWVQHSYKQSRPESEMYNIPFYTNPPRQPLTCKKIQELVIEVCDTMYPQDESSYSEADSIFYTAFVRAVERAHNVNHEGEEA